MVIAFIVQLLLMAMKCKDAVLVFAFVAESRDLSVKRI